MANPWTPDDPTVRDLDSHFENHIVGRTNSDADLYVSRHDDDYPMAFYEGYVSTMSDVHIVDVTDERITFAWDDTDDEMSFDEFVADEVHGVDERDLEDPSESRYEPEADLVIEKVGFTERVSGRSTQEDIDEHDDIAMTFIDAQYDEEAEMDTVTLQIGLRDQRDE